MSCVNELTDSSSTILMGRKMAEGFITHWSNVVSNPDDPAYNFSKKMIDISKIVFSKTLDGSSWNNTIVLNGELNEEIDKLKKQPGNDLIVYGGASFLSALIGRNLIDEYNLFINPVSIGNGIGIFNNIAKKQNLDLVKSIPFTCGIVLLCYALGRESK